ncbi:MAG TPA: hypothetical protein VGN16_22300 [Acidobacteriaceae bacterium]|jgi:hypothetical protein
MDASSNPAVDVRNPDLPLPRPNTGSAVKNMVASALMKAVQFERRFDPLFRPLFDATLRDPLARAVTALINLQRPHDNLQLAEERPLPGEDAFVQSIIDSFQTQLRGLWKPGKFERGGNTKTHGVVRGELVIHPNLPDHLRRGILAEPRSFPAWIRFAGPGPYITPDIDDIGFMSISVKLMDVPGAKLMDEEKFTQDLIAVSTATFVTPDLRANAQLQLQSVQNAQIFYFLNLHEPHVSDFIMQGLWTKTQSSPLEAPYFSGVPYLLGEGQAMIYSFWPTTTRRTKIPNLPGRPPDDYLRQALTSVLAGGEASLEMRVQVQTDAHLMPLENAAVLWPEKLSPRVPVATLRLFRQSTDYLAQLEFARVLKFNPWHSIPEHRPLGNQSRGRKRMYDALGAMRQSQNAVTHYEPTGDEVLS